jgi:DNA-binding LytR/AlgR family response regulator
VTLAALIVDDERPARARLRRLLAQIDGVEVAGEAGGGVEALAKIEELMPSLLLLDIEMPDLGGLDLVRALPHKGRPAVIFVTAFDRYAVEAFDLASTDYLLKPVKLERLQQAISRVSDRGSASLPSLPYRRIVARMPAGGLRVIPVSKLISASVNGRVVYASTTEGTFATNYDLGSLESGLNPEHFLRIHRQHLVSLAAIRELHPLINGTMRVVLGDGTELPVSRAHAAALRERLHR